MLESDYFADKLCFEYETEILFVLCFDTFYVFMKRLSLRISVKFVQTEITFIPFPILHIRLFCRKYQTGPNFIPAHRQTSILFSSVSHDGDRRDARGKIYFSQDQSMKNKRAIAFRHRWCLFVFSSFFLVTKSLTLSSDSRFNPSSVAEIILIYVQCT